MLAPWDEIDLSKPEFRKDKLEILLCQKAQHGEDVSGVIQALDYFQAVDNERHWQKTYAKQAQERETFQSLQKVIIVAFAILGMICFFDRVLNPPNVAPRNNPAQERR